MSPHKHPLTMRNITYILLLMAAIGIASCGNQDDFPEITTTTPTIDTDTATVTPTTYNLDETPLEGETETVATWTTDTLNDSYKDFIANFLVDETTGIADDGDFNADTQTWAEGVKTMILTFGQDTVNIVYRNKKGNTKEVPADDFTITTDGAHITIVAHTKCQYILKGESTDGSFKIYSDNKFIVNLSGLSLTNPHGAALNMQKGNDGGKRCYLVVGNDTRNFLADGAEYDTATGEQEKGVIFNEGKICISGNGYLRVTASGKNAIVSDDYVYLHIGPQITLYPAADHDGIKTNDGIVIAGGVLNIVCQGTKARALYTEDAITVAGGRTVIYNTEGTMPYEALNGLQYNAGVFSINPQ